jgi:hypothetical protein
MDAEQRKKNSDKVEKVLAEVMFEMDDNEEGDLLIDWIVIGYVTNPDDEKASAYPMLYSNGVMPTYRARGLLETGLYYLMLEGITEDD